jgi:CheY-like chemotaxis protein
MTVYVDSDIHARCLEAGMDDLITKPVQAEPLLALIDRFIGCL